MKLYKQVKASGDCITYYSPRGYLIHLKQVEITEEKLKQYLWDEQPFIGGPDDLVRIFMDVLSKLSGE